MKKSQAYAITIEEVHERLCKRQEKKCSPKNLVKDLAWNCAAVARALEELMQEHGAEARAVYGFYHGPCKGKTQPFYRHGWVVADDGRTVWDPTRWVFEGVEPYIFVGPLESHQEYDEGMRKIRALARLPFPATAEHKRVTTFNWSPKTASYLWDLFGGFEPYSLNFVQVLWLANHDCEALGEHIDEVYSALVANDHETCIPIDNFRWWEAQKKSRARVESVKDMEKVLKQPKKRKPKCSNGPTVRKPNRASA